MSRDVGDFQQWVANPTRYSPAIENKDQHAIRPNGDRPVEVLLWLVFAVDLADC